MTKKELKEKAQELIMEELSKIGYSLEDYEGGEEERKELLKEIVKQGNRVAKIMGYDAMWFQ